MKLDNILVLIKNMFEYDRIDLSEGIDTNKNKLVIYVVIGILLMKILIIKSMCVMLVMIYLQKLLVCIIYV